MLLEDFKKPASAQLESINQRLKSEFGFSVPATASASDLAKLKESTDKTIYLLKLNGNTAQSSAELSKHVLVAEAVNIMLEKYDESELQSVGKSYNRVIDKLSDFVADCVLVGDDVDLAMAQAMREYRSSVYRFSDDEVEYDVRARAKDKITQRADETEHNKEKVTEMRHTYVKELRKLLESEVTDAEIIIATKGFSKNLQEMIEKIGRLQNEDLPPLADQMRQEHGVQQASAFMANTQSALQGVMDSLYAAKNEVDIAVQVMAEGDLDSIDMENIDANLSDEMSADPEFSPADEIAGEDEFGDIDSELDQFAADPTMAGDIEEPLGRGVKESRVRQLAKQLLQVQEALDKKLAKSAKK